MIKRADQLPVLLTSFAFKEEYYPELDGMIASARQYHPDWSIVTGRGPVAGGSTTFEIESPLGKTQWSLPVALNLDGSGDDWRKITKMKAWWVRRVWHTFGDLVGNFKRILWVDADERIRGPLDIELDPETEVIAGAWWRDARYPGFDSIATSMLLFQGSSPGTMEGILKKWADICLSHIQKLPNPPLVPWGDSDQEVLNHILKFRPTSNRHYILIVLEANKYCDMVASAKASSLEMPKDYGPSTTKLKSRQDRNRLRGCRSRSRVVTGR